MPLVGVNEVRFICPANSTADTSQVMVEFCEVIRLKKSKIKNYSCSRGSQYKRKGLY